MRAAVRHGEDEAGQLKGVAKRSQDKTSVAGRKWALRRLDAHGVAEAEVIGIGEMPAGDRNDRPLLVELMRGGEIVADLSLSAARTRHEQSLAELQPRALRLSRGEPTIPTLYEGGHS